MKIKVGEPVQVTAPEEPGEKSVMLDAKGMAWQRWGEAWHAVDMIPGGGGDWRDKHANWPTLLVVHGPVVPLHVT